MVTIVCKNDHGAYRAGQVTVVADEDAKALLATGDFSVEPRTPPYADRQVRTELVRHG